MTSETKKTELEPRAAGGRRFENKIVVVAGAGQGIGAAVVRRIAQEGGTVVIGDWVEETAKKVQQEVLDFGEKASIHVGNYSQWEDCVDLMDSTKKLYGRIDSAIIIVGGTIWGQPFEKYTYDQMHAEVNKSFWPTMWCVRAVLPHMIEQHGGSIVTLATHAVVGTGRVPYAASKGGVIGLTTSISKEVGQHAIRINCVAPSAATANDRVTPRNYNVAIAQDQPRRGGMGEGGGGRPQRGEGEGGERPGGGAWNTRREDGTRSERPLTDGLGRGAMAEEVASAIVFMASDDAGYISGQVISVGGGETFPY
jgi:NAD(P)-dependent dehydrogenase (short-subunit alcohol dehydrogenase family)